MLVEQEIDKRFTVDDVTRVYEKIVQVARKGKNSRIFYHQVARIAGLNLDDPYDREIALGRLLGGISEHEKDCGRPLLTAIVVTKETNKPGEGFWGFNKTGMDKNIFWVREVHKVWDYWSKR